MTVAHALELESIERQYELSDEIRELTRVFRFFVAATTCTDRDRVRIESAIAGLLRDTPGLVGEFQDPLRYHPRRDEEPAMECVVTSDAPPLGLPAEFWA